MKFNEAYEYSSTISSVHSSESTTIKGFNKYPSEDVYARGGAGITDRGVTGFAADWEVLAHNKTVGIFTDSTYNNKSRKIK